MPSHLLTVSVLSYMNMHVMNMHGMANSVSGSITMCCSLVYEQWLKAGQLWNTLEPMVTGWSYKSSHVLTNNVIMILLHVNKH